MSNASSKVPVKGAKPQKTAARVVTDTPTDIEPVEAQATGFGPQVPWNGWVGVFYAVAVFFAAQFIASLIIVIYPHLKHWDKPTAISWLNSSTYAQFWYVFFAEAITFIAIVWFIRRMKGALSSIGLTRAKLRDISFALAGFFVYFVTYIVLFYLIKNLIPSINVDQKQQTGFQNLTTGFDLVLTFLSLVVLPPLVEEIVFRGFVFSGLRNKLSILPAALLTSLLFASAHLQIGSGKPLLWVAAIDTFTLSMVLCYVRIKTGSLWAGMLIHAIKNGLAFYSLFLVPYLQLHG